MLCTEQDGRCALRIERELRELGTALGYPPRLVERTQRRKCRASGIDRGCGRRIEPRKAVWIGGPPLRERQDERSEVGGDHFGRIKGWPTAMAPFFPKAIGDPGALPGRTTRTLCSGRLARPVRDEMRGPGRAIEFGAARQARIDHHRHPVQGQRRFGNRGCQHDPAASVRIPADRGTLRCGFNLPV